MNPVQSTSSSGVAAVTLVSWSFDSELQQQCTIPSGEMDDVWDVSETRNGDVIKAAEGHEPHHTHTAMSAVYVSDSSSVQCARV